MSLEKSTRSICARTLPATWLWCTTTTTQQVGDKILWYADLLGFYTTPDGMPYIEHGYLFDREEIAADKSCSKFLKSTEKGSMGKILNNEIVNCTSIYHTPAACVEGKLQIRQHRPGQDMSTRRVRPEFAPDLHRSEHNSKLVQILF